MKNGMTKGLCAVALAGMMGMTQAQAADLNPYQDCGIGAAIFTQSGTAAAISNIIWDLGTTAVASATLTPEACSPQKQEMAQFVIDSYESLAEDTARGEGEYLNAALDLAACEGDFRAQATSDIRTAVGAMVTAPGYNAQSLTEKATGYYAALNQASAMCAG